MSTALVPQSAGQMSRVSADDFMPLLTGELLTRRKAVMNQVIKEHLIEGVDYGVQPGSANGQKVLKKSGAEKLCSTFGLAPKIVQDIKVEDWTGEHHGGEPFFYYEYRIALYRGDLFLGEAGGSCNSWESKYRWRWVTLAEAKDRPDFDKLLRRGGRMKIFEPDFALDKRETTGKYGKPVEYWNRFVHAIESKQANRIEKKLGQRKFWGWEMEVDETLVRIPNPNPADIVNTVQKIAYKRALVAPILVVTNCSDAFTQDLDEEEGESEPHFSGGPAEPDAPHPAENKPSSGPAPAGPKSEPPKQEPPAAAPLFTDPAPARQIPEELQLMIEGIRRDPKKELKNAYEIMFGQFERRGKDALVKHEDLTKAFRNRFPKGSTIQLQDHIDLLLDMWDALQKFSEPFESPAVMP